MMNISPGETQQLRYLYEAPVQALEPADLFWLEPRVLQEVDNLINTTQLPTMSLGAESRAGDLSVARAEVADIVIPADDPLRVELGRALDVGFMYGGLIARQTSAVRIGEGQPEAPLSLPDGQPLPDILRVRLEQAVDGLDPNSVNDSHLLFMRLRDTEAMFAKSDVLAFSLAATQDHMGQQFAAYHKPETDLSSLQISRMQSVYYAGALMGALLSSDVNSFSFSKPQIEILRTMQSGGEPVTIRLEFEPGDQLVDSLDYALSSKMTFSYAESPKEEPYIAAVANGLQFGPNTLSMPVFMPGMEEPSLMAKVPLKEVDALIVRNIAPQTHEPDSFGIVTDSEQIASAAFSKKIVGLLLEEGCFGAYDRSHPNAAVIHQLAARVRGVEPESLSYGFEIVPDNVRPHSRWLGGRAALAAGLVGPWLFEAATELTKAGPIRWEQDVVADVVVLAGYLGLRAAQNLLARQVGQSDRTYQNLLDQITAPR